MLETQKLLKKNYKDGKKILEDLGIKVDESQSDHYIILNYSQINSPKFNKYVNECRALILTKNKFTVAARSFDRFYNYHEDPNSEMIFNNYSYITVIEKIDGSLISIWYDHLDKKQWVASTRSRIYADGLTPNNFTYRDIVDEAFKCKDWPDKFNNTQIPDYYLRSQPMKDHTFVFELVSPETRVVKYYDKPSLYLIGLRNNKKETEILTTHYGIERYLNEGLNIPKNKLIFSDDDVIKTPQTYRLSSYDKIIESMKTLKEEDEGYVCVNYSGRGTKSFQRIKIKNPAHLAMSRVKGNGILTFNKLCEYVVDREKMDKYLEYFPEYADLFEPFIEAKEKLINKVNEEYNKYAFLKEQKEFALAIENNPLKAFLFELRKGNTVEHILQNLSDDKKIHYIEMYHERTLKTDE